MESNGLIKYKLMFIENGFDDLDVIQGIFYL